MAKSEVGMGEQSLLGADTLHLQVWYLKTALRTEQSKGFEEDF